jgi:hypothetical protein
MGKQIEGAFIFMNWKKITKIVIGLIFLVVALVLIYDVVAIVNGGTEASISSFIITMAYKMPFAVYMLGLSNGILIGHLFWRMKGNKDTRELLLDEDLHK